MSEINPLLLDHLKKIPATTSSESLEQVLKILWSTRKTGLGSTSKPDIQTRLNLPSPQHLHPVLACLRVIIRKCVNEKIDGDEIEKLFPNDVCGEVKKNFVGLINKYQNQWREEASTDQSLWQQTRVSNQIKANAPPALTSFTASETSTSLWSQKEGKTCYSNSSNLGGPALSNPFHPDNHSSENMVTIPQLKSMTWTVENKNLAPEKRVAVIALKLQDYTKSPSEELEVKFQLSKDTLESMLKSMVSISDQLSNAARICL